ncbi:hypothetical protein Cgig2_001042 [Carnegiea gigantea]|uniref:Uncharacterized protein n=1 Tax=Carnegiea gigantea TaxID=171969 RepID=A0A9Q1GWW8_9CARY|nr:hypothetical protein Cgig2_001042 [Carnegiea gigantea]
MKGERSRKNRKKTRKIQRVTWRLELLATSSFGDHQRQAICASNGQMDFFRAPPGFAYGIRVSSLVPHQDLKLAYCFCLHLGFEGITVCRKNLISGHYGAGNHGGKLAMECAVAVISTAEGLRGSELSFIDRSLIQHYMYMSVEMLDEYSHF